MTKSKKKGYAKAQSVYRYNIDTFPQVREWFAGNGDRRLGFDRTVALTDDNRSKLARIYGKRKEVFVSEFKFDVWEVEFEDIEFWVLSAAGKGTCIEMMPPRNGWSNKLEPLIVSFLENLYSQLKAVEK